MTKILVAAGVGGTFPTLCRLAASYVSNPNLSFPTAGVYLGIALFFVIGVGVAYVYSETNLQKAFALGVAAPGIVTSLVNGATQPHTQVSAMDFRPSVEVLARLVGASDAYAAGADIRLAQASPQLTVTPSVAGPGVISPNTPISLRFLTKEGNAITSATVSPALPSTVSVPSGAATVQVSVAGVSTTVTLPAAGFQSVHLDLQMKTSLSNDFLWALGAARTAKIQSISASLSQ